MFSVLGERLSKRVSTNIEEKSTSMKKEGQAKKVGTVTVELCSAAKGNVKNDSRWVARS